MKDKSGALRLLFSVLRNAGYEWQPQTPDRLLSFRKNPTPFRPLVQFLGLGLSITKDELVSDGMPEAVLWHLLECEFAREVVLDGLAVANPAPLFKSTMAVSGTGEVFVVHDHWPPDQNKAGGYVHFAAESSWLSRQLNRDLEGFIGKRVLDLGCSSGALCYEVAAVADEALGIDISERSIEWARINSRALGFKNLRFEVARVGDKSAEEAAGPRPWDIMVSNPPMVVPAKDANYSHRDGGHLGIELPLKFLEFAHRHLRDGGEVLTLATNPLARGKPVFFDALPRGHWDFIEKRLLHSHFNQTVARKQGYSDQGIERIELWFLHLKKLP